MEDHISKSNFKAHALEVMRAIEQSGEHIVITSRGKPTLMIKKVINDTRSPLEKLKGSVVKYDAPTEAVDVDDWENA